MTQFNYAKLIDGLPNVANPSDRAARFPNPNTGQKVYQQSTNSILQWDGAAWQTIFLGVGTIGSYLYSGSGSPEGVVVALPASLYLQLDGANNQTLWAKASGSGNTGWRSVFVDGMGVSGVGGTNLSLLARLVLGAATASSDDTALIVARAMVGALSGGGPFSAHAFRDETTMNSSVDGGTYASTDAAPQYLGTKNYNHLHAHQARPRFTGSGILTTLASFQDQSNVDGAGTVSFRYGFHAVNPAGSGTITNNYGFYCDFLDRGGTRNFAFYSTGPTKSSFGGSLNLGTVLRTGITETPDTSVAILVSNTDLTGTAQAGINSGATASNTATNFWSMIAKAAAGGATLTNAYGLNILTATKTSGSVATNYGLKVEDQTVGSSNNYSIFTGVGKLFFGDMIYGIRLRNRSVTNAASPYTLLTEDTSILATANAGPVAVNLHAAAGAQGKLVIVKKVDTSANPVTITPNGADTIQGAANWVLTNPYQYVVLQSDGTGIWYVVGSSRAAEGWVAKSGTYTVTDADDGIFLTGTTWTLTLQAAAGRLRPLRLRSTASGNITIARAGSDTIEGGTSLVIAPGTYLTLMPNGTDWLVV